MIGTIEHANERAFGMRKACAIALTAIMLAAACAIAGTAPRQASALQAGELTVQGAAQPAAATASPYAVGQRFAVDGNTYEITEIEADPNDLSEVKLVKYGSSNKKPTIDTVTYEATTFEVEAIGKNAFNNKAGHKITSVKLGRNVDGIQGKAFYGCKKLKTINLAKSDVIDLEKKGSRYVIDDIDIGKKAFAKAGAANVKVKCGKSSAAYKRAFKRALVSRGLRNSAKVVK